MLHRRHPDHWSFRRGTPLQFGRDAKEVAAPWSSVAFLQEFVEFLGHTIDKRGLDWIGNLKPCSGAVTNVNLAKACQWWHHSILGFGPLSHGNAFILTMLGQWMEG